MMITNSQGSGGEDLLPSIRLVKNIGGCSDGRGSNAVADGRFVHSKSFSYLNGILRPSTRVWTVVKGKIKDFVSSKRFSVNITISTSIVHHALMKTFK